MNSNDTAIQRKKLKPRFKKMPKIMQLKPEKTISFFIFQWHVSISSLQLRSTLSKISYAAMCSLFSNCFEEAIKPQPSPKRFPPSLKQNRQNLLPIFFWRQRCFSYQYRMISWRYSQFIVENVVPNLLHVIPPRYQTVLYWSEHLQDTPGCFCFSSHVLRAHPRHQHLSVCPANNGGKHRCRRVRTSKAHTAGVTANIKH